MSLFLSLGVLVLDEISTSVDRSSLLYGGSDVCEDLLYDYRCDMD